MSQPLPLAALLPAALEAFRTPHLRRVDAPAATPAPAPDAGRVGLSTVLVRVDAAYRRAA